MSFAAAVFVGAAADNPLVTVLARALLVGLVCFAVGSVIGHVAAGVVAREVADHAERFPFPDEVGPANDEPDPASV